MELWQLAEKVGLVFQNPAFQILAPTVEEEILFGLENLGINREQMRFAVRRNPGSFPIKAFPVPVSPNPIRWRTAETCTCCNYGSRSEDLST